jgi:hypothetical protein
MPVYQAIGDALVTRDELVEKAATGELDRFARAIEENPDEAVLDFSTGRATADNLIGATGSRDLGRADFVPVDMSRPLTIEIRNIYTGRYPVSSFFQSRKDMVVMSAIKNLATFNMAPRAVNFLTRQVGPHTNISVPAATDQGTPLVYYTPALTEPSNVLTIDVAFDSYPDELVAGIASMFTGAAGIPIFAVQGPYLLTASALISIFNQVARRLFEGFPAFSATVELSFDRPGSVIPQADYQLVTDSSWDTSTLAQYRSDDDGRLVDRKDGTPYQGPLPYVVISLDGRERKDYEQFTPTAASAALLGRFYNVSAGQDQSLEPLPDALKVYSDRQFRRKADEVSKQLASVDPNSNEGKALKKKYDGYVANILDDILKPTKS